MNDIIFIFFLSYLSGSIPFGLILTKTFTNLDLRNTGSKNIGATNVLRTGNKTLAIVTLFLDILKGYVPVMIAKQYFPDLYLFSALIVFLGHVFPVWLKFSGGKGVATFLGVLIALSHGLAILFIATWLIVTLIFKYSSLSSIFASFTVFVITIIKDNVIQIISPNFVFDSDLKLILFIFLILIIYTHRKNISNLANGKESKIKL